MENKLRIEKRDIYTIEVNDNGDAIEFDLADIELPFKCERALFKIEKLRKEFNTKIQIISKKQDFKKKGEYMSNNEKEYLKAQKEMFKSMRVAMDEFLGQGACQKIFGDRNYIEMYDDLMKELDPHLKKMELNFDGMKNRIKNKYGNASNKVIK